MVIYFLCILGPVIAIWQFAQQPVNIPAAALQGRTVLYVMLRSGKMSRAARERGIFLGL
jgi:hypothetical protein